MPGNKAIYILGYSGHSYVVLDSLISNKFHALGYFDRKEVFQNPYNLMYMGNENNFDFKVIQEEFDVFPSVGDNYLRAKMIDFLDQKSISQRMISHVSATISEYTKIGKSTLVAPSSTINSGSHIGNGVIVNTSCLIEHGCIIDDYVHIAPGAVILGDVKVGKFALIGANSVILNGINIGMNTIIGAGSVVLRDVPDNQTWVGNPARRIK